LKKTTILISQDIRESLKQLGKKGDTYDDIIFRLLEIAKEAKNKK
jgi:predicted CopG family antitoxin